MRVLLTRAAQLFGAITVGVFLGMLFVEGVIKFAPAIIFTPIVTVFIYALGPIGCVGALFLYYSRMPVTRASAEHPVDKLL